MTQILSEQAGAIKLVNEFLSSKGSKFVSFKYRSKGTNELSKYTVLLGVNLTAAYKKDIAKLEKMQSKFDANSVEAQALTEVLNSMKVSIETNFNNPAYTLKDAKERIAKNVSITDNGLQLDNVFLISKDVIEKGTYKTVKSAPKTIAKNEIKKELRVSKIRSFCIDWSNFQSASVNGKKFEIL